LVQVIHALRSFANCWFQPTGSYWGINVSYHSPRSVWPLAGGLFTWDYRLPDPSIVKPTWWKYLRSQNHQELRRAFLNYKYLMVFIFKSWSQPHFLLFDQSAFAQSTAAAIQASQLPISSHQTLLKQWLRGIVAGIKCQTWHSAVWEMLIPPFLTSDQKGKSKKCYFKQFRQACKISYWISANWLDRNIQDLIGIRTSIWT
jgi:hypothetical protein